MPSQKSGHGKEKPTCKESLVAWKLPKSIMKLDVSFSSFKKETQNGQVGLSSYQIIVVLFPG